MQRGLGSTRGESTAARLRARFLMLGVLAMTLLGTSCDGPPQGVTDFRHEADGSLKAAVDYDHLWYQRTDAGTWVALENAANGLAAHEAEAPLAGTPGVATRTSTNSCLDGWCASISTGDQIRVTAPGDNEPQTIWSRDDIPGSLMQMSFLEVTSGYPQAVTWLATTDGTGDPTLVAAIGRLGVMTWSSDDGRSFESVDSYAWQGRFSNAGADLLVVVLFMIPLLILISLMGTGIALAVGRGLNAERIEGGDWPGAGIFPAAVLAPVVLFLLLSVLAVVASGPGWPIAVAVVLLGLILWRMFRAIRVSNENVKTWLIPATVGIGGFILFLVSVTVLAAYRKAGFGGEGGSPFATLFWMAFAGTAVMIPAVSLARAMRRFDWLDSPTASLQ